MWEGGGKLSFYISLCGLEYQIVIYMYIITYSLYNVYSPGYLVTATLEERGSPGRAPGQLKATMNCR
jgi:hypothetical protein